jgi:hypothetical protein
VFIFFFFLVFLFLLLAGFSKHLYEGGLAGSVFSKQYRNLGRSEGSWLDGEFEISILFEQLTKTRIT